MPLDKNPYYIPELDGVRAIAVLAVMLFHLGVFPIGWAGVPLFFVLSGFLITRILVAETTQPLKAFLGKFYWRRTIRIFPLYYAYLAVNAALVLMMGWSLENYGWFIAYLGNHYIGNNDNIINSGVVGHLWSLAVEEQFYLIWPFVIFFFTRHLVVICLSVMIFSFFARYAILETTGNPYLTILTLASCMDMLAAGAIASIIKDRRILIGMAFLGAVILAIGLFAVGYDGLAKTSTWVPQAPYLYTGYALLFAPLMRVAHYVKLLSSDLMRYIGKISYGLYIWHLLAFAIARRIPVEPWLQGTLGMMVSFGIAAFSWRFFESWFLRFKDRFGGSGVANNGASVQ